MLTRESLRAFEKVIGFNLWQLERDYLQHLLLLFLSQRTKREFVFKGGTALQKSFGLNRFSIDLDFTMKEKTEAKGIFEHVARDVTEFGFETYLKKAEEGERGIAIKTGIKGPLYEGTEKTSVTLRIEISRREEVLLEIPPKEITPVYPDLNPYYMLCMDPEEILAEKVRAIIGRGYARDIYDLGFLLKKNVKVSPALIDKKLAYYNKTFGFEEFLGKVMEKKDIWESELKPIVIGRLPAFNEVAKAIEEKFKEI